MFPFSDTDKLAAKPTFKGDPPTAAQLIVLPDRRELALVAVERTRMPMVVTDPRQPDNPIVLANQAFLDLTGYAAEEVLGRNCRFLQGPDTNADALQAIRKSLENGSYDLEVELLNYRKDGTTFLNQLVISPIHDQDGALLYYFASQKDITARRRAEELEVTERLLLMEVDHRAMNALALVQSIIRLSRANSIQDFSASVTGRVDALARAHRLLSENKWSGTELLKLLNYEFPSFDEGRVQLRGGPAFLPACLVQPLSLVLHELMTNAMRHGSLSTPRGTLRVDWTCQDHRLSIEWDESSAALDLSPPSPGFGLSMVRGVIDRQLGGRFNPDWHNGGLRARLEVPIRN